MSDHTHSLLIDLLGADALAAEHGCGLEPRLLEMLLDRHATRAGTSSLGRTIRQDGPVQLSPSDLPRIGRVLEAKIERKATHARR